MLNPLSKSKHDIALCLGDRHELLLFCHSALYAQIPIAHIHGGETTLGSFDDRVRNAVSQLADLHFTAAEPFSQKLRSMSVPGRVLTAGPPGLDELEVSDRSEFGEGYFLVCLHPDTTRDEQYNEAMSSALKVALHRFPDKRAVIVGPNNDPGGREIAANLRECAESRAPRYDYFDSLDRRRYLTALKHASVCIGNSSSFVIEAPALGIPTVLVGDRQRGRPLARSVSEIEPSADRIAFEIGAILNSPRYADGQALPYGSGGASKKIAETLATWS